LFVAFTVFLLPLGPIIVWMAAASPPAYWDPWQRWLAAGFGAFASVFFLVIWLGLLRYNILGRPAVRVAADGLHIGETRVDWGDVGAVGWDHVAGVPYLTIEVDKRLVTTVSAVDRFSMRIAAPPDHPRGPLWITEQQLGERVISAIARVPAGHRPDV
jgi:hypothetical protein